MDIVHQFPSLSHSLFPPYPLLPAPAPRLLLPAPKPPHDEQKTRTPITLTYTHALLDDLTPAQRDQLMHAMTTLLDVSVGYLLDALNLDAFRAAQVAYSRAITGQNPPRPNTPAGFNAEQNAVLVDFMVNSPRAIAAAREQAAREFDAMLKIVRERGGDHE